MITNEERREVARKLRMAKCAWSGMGWRLWLGPSFGKMLLVGGSNTEIEDAARRLADLIDPVQCQVREDAEMVDREALLELADELEALHCPDYDDWDMTVCRIREALGVEK